MKLKLTYFYTNECPKCQELKPVIKEMEQLFEVTYVNTHEEDLITESKFLSRWLKPNKDTIENNRANLIFNFFIYDRYIIWLCFVQFSYELFIKYWFVSSLYDESHILIMELSEVKIL